MTIELRAIEKRFGERAVLAGADLQVPAGRSTVLVGPSASGKTVLLKCLLGLMELDGGEIRVDGELLEDTAGFAARTGVLFQQNALFDSLTVWENVAFRLMNEHGIPKAEARERAIARLAAVGLDTAKAELHPAELSGGMQKRVAVARAMAADPDILILDDPTAGLDPILTNHVFDLIERAVEGRGVTVLAVTGDMTAATTRFDRLAMLHDGHIRWQGETAELPTVSEPHVRQMVDGTADGPIRMRVRD